MYGEPHRITESGSDFMGNESGATDIDSAIAATELF